MGPWLPAVRGRGATLAALGLRWAFGLIALSATGAGCKPTDEPAWPYGPAPASSDSAAALDADAREPDASAASASNALRALDEEPTRDGPTVGATEGATSAGAPTPPAGADPDATEAAAERGGPEPAATPSPEADALDGPAEMPAETLEEILAAPARRAPSPGPGVEPGDTPTHAAAADAPPADAPAADAPPADAPASTQAATHAAPSSPSAPAADASARQGDFGVFLGKTLAGRDAEGRVETYSFRPNGFFDYQRVGASGVSLERNGTYELGAGLLTLNYKQTRVERDPDSGRPRATSELGRLETTWSVDGDGALWLGGARYQSR